ncbi:SET domain-containing protein-lysine N-methyltransferase [Candidatus Woesearchaeota archaeon]|nr:SET domain-containing protein-lysine N-methyltransferase [Candidatus Woesearchaeota archaeon]
MLPGVKGAFAIRDIPKGTQIVQYRGKLISKELSEKISSNHRDRGELWIFTLNDKYDIDGSRQGNESRYVNHSCDPNCEAINYDDDEVWIETIRDIKKGEELTYDYGFDEPDEAFPCLCGSPKCRKWIVVKDYKFKPGEHEELLQKQKEFLEENIGVDDKTHFAIKKKKEQKC